MKALDLSKAIQENKLSHTKLSLNILKWLYSGYEEYDERYGVMIHPKTGVSAGIPLPNYIGDINCAIEAVKRLLPSSDFSIYINSKGMNEGTVWIDNRDDELGETEFTALHENPCSALLTAAFRAKYEMIEEPEND